MTTLLTNARLIDPEAGTDTLGALLIEDGVIARIFDTPDGLPDKSPTLRRQDADGKCLAPGIVDLGVKIGEPGERHKESFRSAGLA
ncbi:MAG: dihydroorotase, partial [Rhodobacteraceae bacterium]|nr:dihydroorotase [Paracoccaceae bacterium]